jgi:hypothetical protein
VVQWDACTNIRVRQLETGCTLENYVTAFNCNTNLWMARYCAVFTFNFQEDSKTCGERTPV